MQVPNTSGKLLWLLLAPVLALLLLLPRSGAAAPPTESDLRAAENVARAFAQWRMEEVRSYLSPGLAGKDPSALLSMRKGVEQRFGNLRAVQAAWALSPTREARTEQVRVPLDFERGTLDLWLAWRGELLPGSLVAFRLLPRVDRHATARTPAPVAWRDALYVDHARFSERDVQLPGEPLLPALLSEPIGPGPFPALYLLPDPDAPDVRGSFGANRLQQDLAHGLATAGVVVLRAPQRAPGNLGPALEADILTDALEGLQRLARLPRVDPRRVGVLGRDVSAVAAIDVVRRQPGLAYAIALAPPGTLTPDAVLRREEALLDAPLSDLELLSPEGDAFFSDLLDRDRPVGRLPIGLWRDYAAVDVPGTLRRWRGSLLILLPSHDVLPPERHGEWLVAPRTRAPRRVYSPPETTRWFLPYRGEKGPDGARLPAHITPETIRSIATFVAAKGPP